MGKRCIIVDTANVLSRCPELVGSVGESGDPVPMPRARGGTPAPHPMRARIPPGLHWGRGRARLLQAAFETTCGSGEVVGLPKPPSKWIDVHVCDGRVIKFQSSALRVGRVPDAETRPPKNLSLSLSLSRSPERARSWRCNLAASYVNHVASYGFSAPECEFCLSDARILETV